MIQDLTGMAHVQPGTVRVAPLQQLPQVLSECGLAIEPLLDLVGLPRNTLAHPENTIPVEAGARLLSLCAERSGRPHFGLLAGQRVRPASLGLIGLLMLHSGDVGSALRGLLLTLHLNGRAVVPSLVARDGNAALSLSLFGGYTSGGHQVADFTIAVACNLMRALCGPQWVPSEVQFAHRPPADRRPYHRFFKASLRFDSDRTALLFPSSWLAHRVPGANPETRKTLQHAIAMALSQQDFDLLTKVRRALFAMIVQNDVSVDGVATMLGMHKRTLNRRLVEQGTTIARMLSEVRFQLARQLLSDTALPFVEIAAALNYADASTFSRAFRAWAGTSPSAWRDGKRQVRTAVRTLPT
jgi:AraC-like DNA-binding protein